MRKGALCLIFIAGLCGILLTGCPYSSVYTLDPEPALPINEDYLGKWAVLVNTNSNFGEPVKLILSKKSDTEYAVAFTGDVKELLRYRISLSDTLKGTGYLSTVDHWEFLNFVIRGEVFIIQILYDKNKLTLLPMAESFTNKHIGSDQQLREALRFHMKTRLRPRYDDDFCLRNMVRVN
ncbi:MAG: hypothetical protein KIS82_03705 [Ferruginibacter sp.]|nr:hypothetical protein [Bacteroidota bacterium]MCW5916434.1 hypothetical protein [Ferruginibacter sp.]